MRVFIMRHGEAASASDDDSRPLTPHGRAQSSQIAIRLKDAGYEIGTIEHSDKLRAYQTAEVVSEYFPEAELKERSGIRPEDASEEIAYEISQSPESSSVLFVSHMPFVAHLTSRLLSGDDRSVPLSFSTSSVAVLVRTATGNWVLEEFLRA